MQAFLVLSLKQLMLSSDGTIATVLPVTPLPVISIAFPLLDHASKLQNQVLRRTLDIARLIGIYGGSGMTPFWRYGSRRRYTHGLRR